MFSLNGKKALVTGATGGIGGAIARSLREAGADVAVSGSRAEKLEAFARELGAGGNPARVFPVVCDLSKPETIDTFLKDAEARLGGLDILVCNAGITRDNLSMRMKDDEWQSVLDVNLTATFRLIRASLKGMMKQRAGRIVTITSVVGATGNPGQANYCAAKAGLVGMSKSLAQEVASRGITVNCIAPGFIATPMTGVLTDEQKARILPGIPQGKMGVPEDIAAAALYLASDEAAYVTGQTLHVNGGMYMG